jgi:phosphatidylglycerol---prolipoprotein diacylglyceryl transferase
MFPVITIGSAILPTYPFSIIVAAWVGLWLAGREARRLGIEDDHVYNAGLFGLIGALLGARFWFVASHWDVYRGDLSQALALNTSALAGTEGLTTGLTISLIYLLRYRLPLARVADVVAPGLVLALAVQALGASLGGVGPGLPADVPWAIDILDARRHPVQLYNLTGCLIILVILYWRRDRLPWDGFNFWLFVVLYSGLRLFTEAFRVTTLEMVTSGGFRLNQLVAWGVLIVALAIMARGAFRLNRLALDPEPLPHPSTNKA